MPDDAKPAPGRIGCFDLTVADAERVDDFYCQVTGWTASPVDMGGYSDYCLSVPSGEAVAGVCHARGCTAGLPPVWLIYITVVSLEESLRRCEVSGGKVRTPPHS